MTSSTGTVGLALDVGHDGSYRIASIVPGSSAEASREIDVGDQVDSIDDIILQGPSDTKTLFQSEALLNGTAGTVCKVGLRKHDGRFYTAFLARRPIDLAASSRLSSIGSPAPSARGISSPSPMPSSRFSSSAIAKTQADYMARSRQSSASPAPTNRNSIAPMFDDAPGGADYSLVFGATDQTLDTDRREIESTRIGVNLDTSPHGGVCISALSPLGW
jgi:hypothetical protein